MDKSVVMDFIDLLAYHKINTLRMHLTDDEAWRLEIKSHPELAKVGGFRGGDSPIWPRYGKWNEEWGGYYTQEDMCEIVEYAAVRNIDIIPEIDLPGHSLCIATMHPEILCDYTPNTASSFGYDTRSAFCASREENYELLADILGEVCELFPSEYIHIGGDEVEMSQWKRCPSCQALMRDNNMVDTSELQQYFISRLSSVLVQYGKKAAVWNEAIDGGKLSVDTRVYGWESVKECRAAAVDYATVVMPGQFFYFDMKQSLREPGHDWAAIFDWRKVYGFTLASQGFTEGEQANVLGFEGSFFSEVYASHNPETPDYLHYQTFPRLVALAEIAWVDSEERDVAAFYNRMVEHYNRLDAMGVAYRLMPPAIEYKNGVLAASTNDGSKVFYRREPMCVEMLYTAPIITDNPAEYCFVSRRGEACSPEAGVAAHFKTITPTFGITSSMNDSEKFSFDKAEGYGRLARTTRAGDVGDWVMFTFEQPVSCRRMKVATGNFQLPRFIFENGYVEVSYDGVNFEQVGELDCGMFVIEYPACPIKAVRITCTSRGNGAEWVSIQPPTIWPKL
jgi:hexosaminidase